MFTTFFYTLKNNGLDISTTEWITLMDGLDKGLAHSSFTDFYYLCRTVLVKNEGDYDKLDMAQMKSRDIEVKIDETFSHGDLTISCDAEGINFGLEEQLDKMESSIGV